MRSLIFRTSARALQPLILFFSLVLLARGHDEPGGGFVGGLAAAAAIVLHAMAYGASSARRALHFDPRTIAGIGIVIAALTATAPLFFSAPLLETRWARVTLGPFGSATIGSPLVFDAGVYLLVLGSVLAVVLALSEE